MILIVDSENVADIKIKQSFVELGFQSIEVAKTGAQAKQFLSEERKQGELSLVIINHELDDINGFDLCREIKKTEAGKNVFILILVSSLENKTAIEKARHSGASGFSVKPYGSNEFLKNFKRYVAAKAVLIVEDDPLIRIMVRKILQKHSVEIIEIDDGIKANNLINTMLPPRLVLLDIGLPNMKGSQLIKNIRSKTDWQKTPVVMLTGSTDAADVKGSLSAGANDYIVKPVKIDDFTSRMTRYLSDEK